MIAGLQTCYTLNAVAPLLGMPKTGFVCVHNYEWSLEVVELSMDKR